MSAETSSFTLFPLGEDATNEARNWLQSHSRTSEELDTEKQRLLNRNEDLYVYINRLCLIRGIVQFDHDQEKINAYWNGALYMIAALDKQYDDLFRDLPTPSEDAMRTHFLNLLDVENNHGAIEQFAPYIFDDPDNGFIETTEEFLDGYGDMNFEAMMKLFAINSQYEVHEMFDTSPHLQESLLRSGLHRTHAPAYGLVYGAYDMFSLFKIHEDGVSREEQYQIPTR